MSNLRPLERVIVNSVRTNQRIKWRRVPSQISLDQFSALFKNVPSAAASLSFISCLFKQTIQILHQKNLKKCPSSIQWSDSNSWPFEHESSAITVRLELHRLLTTFTQSINEGINNTEFETFYSVLNVVLPTQVLLPKVEQT